MSSTTAGSPTRKMSTWEKNLLGVTVDQVPSLLPGLLVAALLAWFSVWLSNYVGVTLLHFDKTPISAVMLAIMLPSACRGGDDRQCDGQRKGLDAGWRVQSNDNATEGRSFFQMIMLPGCPLLSLS